jgi:hypothetical protein
MKRAESNSNAVNREAPMPGGYRAPWIVVIAIQPLDKQEERT